MSAITSAMWYMLFKAGLSGLIIAVVSDVSRRLPALGALIVSLPLVSLMGMIWLWHDTGDAAKVALHAQSTFWYVLPSLPLFLLIPALLRHGAGFWTALALSSGVTIVLYIIMAAVLMRLGFRL